MRSLTAILDPTSEEPFLTNARASLHKPEFIALGKAFLSALAAAETEDLDVICPRLLPHKVTFAQAPEALIRGWQNPHTPQSGSFSPPGRLEIQDLQDRGCPVQVRWVPAHVGIPGNEAADIAAKEATGWREDGRRAPTADEPPRLFPLKTTLRRRCGQQAEIAWRAKWRKDTKGRATFRNTPAPTKRVLKLHKGLRKRDSALVQLRTEKSD